MKKGPTKHCRTCLETFATSPSAVSRKYCSTACAYQAFHIEGWAKSKPKVVKSCEACGTRIETHPSDATRKRFCSQRCHLKTRGEEQTKQNAVLFTRNVRGLAKSKRSLATCWRRLA
mgnify:CR=1 FL=1